LARAKQTAARPPMPRAGGRKRMTTMKKQEIIQLLKSKGFSDKQIIEKRGGVEVVAEKRVPMFEFDYNEFVFKTLDGRVAQNKIHFLDNWTFTIECEP
jgi:hypothetical protein